MEENERIEIMSVDDMRIDDPIMYNYIKIGGLTPIKFYGHKVYTPASKSKISDANNNKSIEIKTIIAESVRFTTKFRGYDSGRRGDPFDRPADSEAAFAYEEGFKLGKELEGIVYKISNKEAQEIIKKVYLSSK